MEVWGARNESNYFFLMDGTERSSQSPPPPSPLWEWKKKTQEFLSFESSFKMWWGNQRHYLWGLPAKGGKGRSRQAQLPTELRV